MAEPARAYSRARPVRVAYLVEELDDDSSAMLDAIFAECMGRWGGRFSLIVPASPDGPRKSYEQWLEAFDPDVIYSYVALGEAAVLRLHEWLYPSFLLRHETFNDARDAHAFRPRLPIAALSATTLLPRAAAPGFDGKRGCLVIDAMGRMRNDPMVADSFGYFGASVGSSFGPQFSEFGSVLTMVADDEAQPRQRFFRDDAQTVSDIPALLETMANSRVVTMSQLAAMASPRLDVVDRRAGAFNLVVGDTFVDRVFYWNMRSLFPKWRDGSFVDLRLPEATLDDPSLIAALSSLLKRRNSVSQESTNSQPQVALRSNSVTEEKLRALAKALQATMGWVNYSVEPDLSLDDCVPTNQELTRANYVTSEGLFSQVDATWHDSPAWEEKLELTPPAPEHLRLFPPSLASPHSGCWAVDINIERQLDHSPYDNVRHRWRLPRRLRITSAFLRSYEMSQTGWAVPRVAHGGVLTAYAEAGSRFPSIQLPTDEDAIRIALVDGRDWYPFERRVGNDSQMLRQLLADTNRSQNGRHFWGVLGLMDGLSTAQSMLLHRFWLDVFDQLGGSYKIAEARRTEVLRQLEKHLQPDAVDTTANKNTLARIVMEEAERFRTAVPSMTWTAIERMFKRVQSGDWKVNRSAAISDRERKEWQQHEFASFRRRVQNLCALGVLHQGYAHRCRKCLHRSWIAIGALRDEVVCEVCREREPAPIDRPWEFRLNEFLREGLRKRGLLPLVWCLKKLRSAGEESFFFEGPLDVYVEKASWEAGKPDTDIDLICVADGIVHMCEAKQSTRQLDAEQTKRFGDLMKRLRPDVAVIAVMEPENEAIHEAFRSLNDQLAGTGIRAQLITFDESRDLEHGLYGIA